MPISVLDYYHLPKMLRLAFSVNVKMSLLKKCQLFYVNMKDAKKNHHEDTEKNYKNSVSLCLRVSVVKNI